MSASTTRTAPAHGGPRVRPELPRARVVTLAVHDLSVDPGPDGSRLHGLDLELRAGTLTVATPAAPARTLARVLVGDLPGRDGDLVTGQGRTRRRLTTTSWTALAARTPPTTGRATVEVLHPGGLAAIRLGVHLGLGPLLDRPLAVLDAAERTLVGLALALAAAPDLVVLDLPAAGLDPRDAVASSRPCATSSTWRDGPSSSSRRPTTSTPTSWRSSTTSSGWTAAPRSAAAEPAVTVAASSQGRTHGPTGAR